MRNAPERRNVCKGRAPAKRERLSLPEGWHLNAACGSETAEIDLLSDGTEMESNCGRFSSAGTTVAD